MRLKECDLDSVAVQTSSLVINRPESIWETAHQSEIIPATLYHFYCTANYFSYGQSPRFLSDTSGILFPYLGNLARGIRDSFEEIDELFGAIKKDYASSFSPAKKIREEAWDPKASHKVRRSFRNLVVLLTGTLDQFAEVAAIFFYSEMPKIKVGRASFTDLMDFATTPFPPVATIAPPRKALLEKLHVSLVSELLRDGPDKEWATLLFLYRNKLAHLGNFSFWWFGFPHKTETEFYTFLPNQWPLIVEEHITRHSASSPSEPNTIREFAEKSVIQQDILEYSEKLILAVKQVIESGFNVLTDSYKTLHDCEPFQDAVDSLRRETKVGAFQFFP